MMCENCNKNFITDFRKDERYKRKYPPRFCSIECSRLHSKEVKEKISKALRKNPKRFCKCGKEIIFKSKRGLCLECWSSTKTAEKDKYSFFKEHKNWQSARSSIRRNACKVYFEINKKDYKCAVCNYSNYIEVAHRKSVSEFDEKATLEEINDINNLIGLCPNHHWEFDKGILKL